MGLVPTNVSLSARTLFVDGENGNDNSGTRGRSDRPFATIGAARTAAQFGGAGDCIIVRPGTYPEDNLCKGGGAKSVTTSSTIARVSSVVTVPVGAAHGIAVGDLIWLVASNVPASGFPFTGAYVVSAVASTTISFYFDGPDETVATTANDRVIRPLSYHFMPGTVVGYPSDLTRTASLFDTTSSGVNATCWVRVTGDGVFRHTQKIINSNSTAGGIGDRFDFECLSARGTGASGVEAIDLQSKNGWYNIRAKSDITNQSYDAIICGISSPGVRFASIETPLLAGGYTGGNALEIAGTTIDFSLNAGRISGYGPFGDAAINLQSTGAITRGSIRAGFITGALGSAIYNFLSSSSNLVIEAGEISSAGANAVEMVGGGVTFKDTRIKSTIADALYGCAVAYTGAGGTVKFHNVVLVSNAIATNGIYSPGNENTIKVYGTCLSNKAIMADDPGVEGIIQQVGTFVVDSNVS